MAHNGQRLRGLFVRAVPRCSSLRPRHSRAARLHSQSQRRSASSAPPPDFLLGRPRGSIGVRGSWSSRAPTATSTTSSPTPGDREVRLQHRLRSRLEFGFSLTPRFDIVGDDGTSTGWIPGPTSATGRTIAALPIQQTTELSQMNLTVSARSSRCCRAAERSAGWRGFRARSFHMSARAAAMRATSSGRTATSSTSTTAIASSATFTIFTDTLRRKAGRRPPRAGRHRHSGLSSGSICRSKRDTSWQHATLTRTSLISRRSISADSVSARASISRFRAGDDMKNTFFSL